MQKVLEITPQHDEQIKKLAGFDRKTSQYGITRLSRKEFARKILDYVLRPDVFKKIFGYKLPK